MLPLPSEDRAAIVTGASSGIGDAIARELAQRGHRVVLVARRADRLQQLADTLGERAHVVPADLSQPNERAEMLSRITRLGLIPDILVNNAGLTTVWPVSASDVAAELNLVEVDVAAVVDLCSRLVPGMVARRRGAVLNVASVGAFAPVPGQATYGGAKAFVLAYTQAMRTELRGTGVTAATLCPGPVSTHFSEVAGLSNEDVAKLLPKAFWKTPPEVAVAAMHGLDKNRGVIIPGALNRASAALSHLTPRNLLLPFVARSHPGLK